MLGPKIGKFAEMLHFAEGQSFLKMESEDGKTLTI